MKVIVLSGRLTGDPEFKEYPKKEESGMTKRCAFSVANNDIKDKPEYFNVVAWGDQAVFLKDRLKKGNTVLIHGTFHQEPYETEDGAKRKRFYINPVRVEYWN